jgi:hypothetical protein
MSLDEIDEDLDSPLWIILTCFRSGKIRVIAQMCDRQSTFIGLFYGLNQVTDKCLQVANRVGYIGRLVDLS